MADNAGEVRYPDTDGASKVGTIFPLACVLILGLQLTVSLFLVDILPCPTLSALHQGYTN
jgi:hypothetical protein